MDAAFYLMALVTVGGAIAAMSLRNLVHCALCLAVTFAGLAGCYLTLGAQFLGFAQVLVYVGAVAILVVFAILLTRGGGKSSEALVSPKWFVGLGIAVLTFGTIGFCVFSSTLAARPAPEFNPAGVRQIGFQLMTRYVLPLETLALLLTAAMIGAVVIAMRDSGPAGNKDASNSPEAAIGKNPAKHS
jgi:NADH-quinone oxidoreductase subunit J